MKRPSDRQAKIDRGTRTPVGLAVISSGDGHLMCSCGQPFIQRRRKVREDAAERHVNEKHNGQAVWL